MNKALLEALEMQMELYLHLIKKGYTTKQIQDFFRIVINPPPEETEEQQSAFKC